MHPKLQLLLFLLDCDYADADKCVSNCWSASAREHTCMCTCAPASVGELCWLGGAQWKAVCGECVCVETAMFVWKEAYNATCKVVSTVKSNREFISSERQHCRHNSTHTHTQLSGYRYCTLHFARWGR